MIITNYKTKKMKTIKILRLKISIGILFAIVFLSIPIHSIKISNVAGIKIKNSNSILISNSNNPADYNPVDSPSVIRELFKKIKKLSPKGSDIHEECLNLIVNEKNMEDMKTFWNELKASQEKEPPEKMKKKYFSSLINSTEEGVEVDGRKMDCKTVVGQNLMDTSEIENNDKQNELATVVYPYFHHDPPKVTGKNIITAYLDIHRDSEGGRTLIHNLTKKE